MANKLELTWVGKDEEIKLEPRILIENPTLSNIEKDKDTENMLIHGDNLLALKALESKYAGQIKCIYIDPPYNTGKAFNNYDDNIEHSLWLSLIRERLLLLHRLLSYDGVIFIQINDDEAAYLKVLCDEVFGRSNYETTFYVKVRHENRILREDSKYQLCIEQVLCYRKTDSYKSPRREKTNDTSVEYKWEVEITGDCCDKLTIAGYEVELYRPSAYRITKVKDGTGSLRQYSIRGSLITQSGSAAEYYEYNLRQRREIDGLGMLYKVIGMGVAGDGIGYRYIMQPEKESSKNGLYFQGKPLKTKKDKGLPYPNFYDMTDAFNNAGYEGYGYFNGGKKPEAWIDFLLSLVELKDNDIVLDSFLGSGTTAAVCAKKGHKFIGVEMGEHAYTLCIPRLDSIISGTDKEGIYYSHSAKCGYKFYELAPSLIVEDKFGNPVINKGYNADMLAAAMALHEGFVYSPDENYYWKQGRNENAYIYTTTVHLTEAVLDAIAKEMREDEYLVIACKSYDADIERAYKNIKIKKIPQFLLGRCEFGKDNYNLNIVDVPVCEEESDE